MEGGGGGGGEEGLKCKEELAISTQLFSDWIVSCEWLL